MGIEMRSQYRVLSAMATLRTFTISDLARVSGVKEPTVRTVLNRNSQYYCSAGKAREGASLPRGGQTMKLAVSDEQQQAILAKLEELYPKLPWAPFDESELDAAEVARQKKRAEAPGLQALQELFMGAINSGEPLESDRLLRTAATNLASVAAEMQAIRNSGVLPPKDLEKLEKKWGLLQALIASPKRAKIRVSPPYAVAAAGSVPVYMRSVAGNKLGEFSPSRQSRMEYVKVAAAKAPVAGTPIYIKQSGSKPLLNALVHFAGRRTGFARLIKVKRSPTMRQQPRAFSK
jgi:hypothetical protein